LSPPVEVYDNSRRKVRAKMLVDAAGRQIRDPTTGMPLVVDEDFDINDAIAFGRALAPMMGAGVAIRAAAQPGAIGDMTPAPTVDLQ
jgi:hypothetical protein